MWNQYNEWKLLFLLDHGNYNYNLKEQVFEEEKETTDAIKWNSGLKTD